MIVWLIRLGYVLAASLLLIISGIPALQKRFFAYGPRSAKSSSQGSGGSIRQPPRQRKDDDRATSVDLLSAFLDHLATYLVPHSWFIHFYILSVLCSAFWAYDLMQERPYASSIIRWDVFLNLCQENWSALLQWPFDWARVKQVQQDAHSQADVFETSQLRRSNSMSLEQIFLAWALMFLQGARRLYECLVARKSSQSRMWIMHWVLGIAFYASMSTAVWIEGLPTLATRVSDAHGLSFANLPPLHTALGIPLFLCSAVIQHQAHAYLASLRTYQVPSHPVFKHVFCPHYTAEIGVYLAIGMVAAPLNAPHGGWTDSVSTAQSEGWALINWTIFSAAFFVAVNLGITARGTREWYQIQFGLPAAGPQWGMLPHLV